MDGDAFQRKIDQLELETHELEKSLTDYKLSTSIVISILAPLILWLFFYFWSPWFVTNDEGKTDKVKVGIYALVISVVIWIAIFSYSRYAITV